MPHRHFNAFFALSLSARWIILGLAPLPAFSIAFAADNQFARPTIDGKRLDWCLNWGANCGEAAADAFCRRSGYGDASEWRQEADVGPTWVLGDQRDCPARDCDGFLSISCAPAAPSRTRPSASNVPAAPMAATISDKDPVAMQLQVCKAQSDEMRGELDRLKHQIGELQAQLVDATRKPYCSEDGSFSINPINNAKELCDPYLCNPVDGRCFTRCTISMGYCSRDFICNRKTEKCYDWNNPP